MPSSNNYERKPYLLPGTPEGRRYAGNHWDVYQYPDGGLRSEQRGSLCPTPRMIKMKIKAGIIARPTTPVDAGLS
jgi:hypothetical protein